MATQRPNMSSTATGRADARKMTLKAFLVVYLKQLYIFNMPKKSLSLNLFGRRQLSVPAPKLYLRIWSVLIGRDEVSERAGWKDVLSQCELYFQKYNSVQSASRDVGVWSYPLPLNHWYLSFKDVHQFFIRDMKKTFWDLQLFPYCNLICHGPSYFNSFPLYSNRILEKLCILLSTFTII